MIDTVDLVIEDPRWEDADLPALAERGVKLALEAAGIMEPVEVSVLGTNDAGIAKLNSAFRGKDSATNVLSWPSYDLFPAEPGGAPSREIPAEPFGRPGLGDIALAYDTVVKEATEAGLPLADHITHLVLHGCLHLLGYDHETDEDASIMEELEQHALASLGIAAPY